MSNRFLIKDEMGIAARNLAAEETDPAMWGGWVVYMLECLESEAIKHGLDPDHPRAFETCLDKLADGISDRRQLGRW